MRQTYFSVSTSGALGISSAGNSPTCSLRSAAASTTRGSVLEGKSLAENTEFDFAVLDINLCGRNVLPVAQAIEKRGLPFLFVSGYKHTDLPAPFRDRLLVEKPIEISKLKAAIGTVLGGQSGR
jgi:DNA-binding response OmpR family regulator